MVGKPIIAHEETQGRVWRAKVKLLPGRYEYKLFADNAWVENLTDVEIFRIPLALRTS